MLVKRGWALATGAMQCSPPCCGGAAASGSSRPDTAEALFLTVLRPSVVLLAVFFSFGTVAANGQGRSGAHLPSLLHLAAWSGQQQQYEQHHKWRASTRDEIEGRFCCFFRFLFFHFAAVLSLFLTSQQSGRQQQKPRLSGAARLRGAIVGKPSF